MKATERVFEQEIEWALIHENGYVKGNPASYNKELAMDTGAVLEFIKKTQAEEWKRICRNRHEETGKGFLNRLNDELSKRGIIDVLRDGITDLGVKVVLCYEQPTNTMNKTACEQYDQNTLQVTRQVKYSLKNENSVDMVIFLNGLPIITIELKNPLTGQTFQNAVEQYKNDRDPRELLFTFKKRCVVHFAMDSEEIRMTTKLDRLHTYFIPFNRGYNYGAGNPPVTGHYRTSYLWQDILKKDSIIDIVRHFVKIEKDEETQKEKLLFPRFHQLDVVRQLLKHAYRFGSGHTYLVQHSAGSGKSHSISWLAHHLASLYDSDNKIIFNSIIVITDRQVLDQQLRKDVYGVAHKKGVVVRVDKNSKQLTEALENDAKIIVCTLQKFPFVDVERISTKGKKFAVIVDEAHSSQTGQTSERLKEVLADISTRGDEAIERKLHEFAEAEAQAEAEEFDRDEDLAEQIRIRTAAHGKQKNLSFFAFTATPKQKTLEIFGTKNENGTPEPFHVYSMKQAVEEGFIFDVLKNYTTYQTYYKVGKTVADDPMYSKKQANKALGKYLSLHPHNLAQKTEIIIEHFRSQVKRKIGGKAKAMLVTGSRLHAVRYYFEFKNYIRKMNYTDLGILVAFSGTVRDTVNGSMKEYTEVGLNHCSEKELPKTFEKGEYHILLVAEKYQTGFDQPLLHTMYVDKKLSSIKAVQTLSRVNRICKGKTDTFILDFVNSEEDIRAAFQDYYQSTTISENTDPNTLYDIKYSLDTYKIYNDGEIRKFAHIFFKETKTQKEVNLGKIYAYIDPAVERFKELPESSLQQEFSSSLLKFLRLYSFLTHIINLGDDALYTFYVYAKFLARKLPHQNERTPHLDNEVVLQYYRLDKIAEKTLSLAAEPGVLYNATAAVSVPLEDEYEKLSKILEHINERFGTNFTEMDKVLEQIVQDMAKNKELILRAQNPIDLFKIVYDENIMEIILARLTQNQAFCTRYLDDTEFRSEIDKLLLPLVHERLSKMNGGKVV